MVVVLYRAGKYMAFFVRAVDNLLFDTVVASPNGNEASLTFRVIRLCLRVS